MFILISFFLFPAGTMVYRISLLLLVFMAAATSTASADKQTYIVHMDKAKITALDSMLGDSRKWYEEVMDSITELSTEEEGGEEETSPPQLLYAYETAITGFAAKLSTKQLESLNKVEGFMSAVPDEILSLHTTHSPQFLGLHPWRGLWFAPHFTTDVIIGVIDSGIWPEHVSFHDWGMPPVPSRWKGVCEEGTNFTSSNCNKKLIGARAFFEGYESQRAKINETEDFRSPRDSQGHGTHTASIAAGNVVPGASLFGMGKGFASGMMYTSRIAVYKACYELGCFASDVVAAIDQAVSDGVDVLSLSLGGPSRPYYSDPVAIASLRAVQKGVAVAFPAGNTGPSDLSVFNSAPWMMTVAASSMDRSFSTIVKLGNGEIFHGASLYSGKSTQQLLLVYNETAGEEGAQLCNGGTLSPDLVKGKIVVCDRGIDSPVERGNAGKGEVVKMAGGAGMLLLNTDRQGEELIADPHILPATSLGASAANSIRKYLTSGNATASIFFKGTAYGNPAPAVAAFSSRGPAFVEAYVIKPDMTAPGVNILAAWPPTVSPSGLKSDKRSVTFNVLSGTSMSCPHVSGIAALLKSVHKDWSPAAIKSALMTTAYTQNNNWAPILDLGFNGSESANPFAYGSGHVDPMKAANPGLIYDITHEDYLNYLCSLKYTPEQMALVSTESFTCPNDTVLQPGDLNYPSFAVVFNSDVLNNSATYRRTVTNVGFPCSTYVVRVQEPEGVSVRVEPNVLKFRHLNEKLSYRVSFVAERENSSSGNAVFGSLSWVFWKYTVRSPIAVTWQQPEDY
ncbi:hypothetical protein PVL29_019969 [Vitis rotundifolia]|uniref:Subtilisin-like protease SBT1.1 n=1 Tax=Vitis rotundifolia TaxID=103349 RepID=A0AA39DE87_VITRO|nr:hypothetical protein PVL29_019969 [Vitis rotundifolia]